GVAVDGSGDAVDLSRRFRPVVLELHPDLSFREHLHAVARARAEAVRHAAADFGAIVRDLHRARDPARPWLFGVTFAVDPEPGPLAFGETAASVTHVPAPHLDGEL